MGLFSSKFVIQFNHSGDRLASASEDSTVKIWKEYKPGNTEGIATENNDSTWKCVCTLAGFHNRPVYDIDWCHRTGNLLYIFKKNLNQKLKMLNIPILSEALTGLVRWILFSLTLAF